MHSLTPTLTVIDPRNLALRSVDYYRADPGDMAEARVERTTHDPVGRAVAQWDSRLFQTASAPANLVTIHGLSGTALCTLSVDAGLRVNLFGEADQPVQSWDGRGSQRWMHYDNQLRLKALFEQTLEGEAICAEHLTYAANDPVSAAHNQCGQLISHTDLAGVLLFNDYGLTAALLEQERRLGDIAQSFSTHSRFNPPGDLLSRTDAQGNEQRFSQTVDGQLRAVDLRLSHTTQHLPMVSAITYNAHGQVEREIAGNGVITTLEYAAEDGRLQRLLSRLGQNEPLQDLRYSYDPVGNVRSIKDAALPIRYFANQRIEPVSDYWYDTLDRLIAATGWEAGAVKNGPSSAMTADPAMPGNYRQSYRYDAGNNLLELIHTGPQNPGHRLVADAHSNRCLPVRDGIEPTEQDFRDSFDANGNLLTLQPGQTLRWDARNQLCEVRPVVRDTENDSERYLYGADGLRVRKVRSLQTNAQTNIIETLYLPGLEIRTHSGTGEVLHVIDVATGRGSVRVLHWEAERPTEISNDQQRYCLTDHLGSSTLELDQHANVITQERYYPFGGTAWSNGEAVQVSYKTVRYSGKERDATGLYYYGFRYYVPWLQCWLNPDPAGAIDGLNLYRIVRNNPMTFVDEKGMFPEKPVPTEEDVAALDGFFSGSEFKEFKAVRKEIHELGSGFKVFGVRVSNPFNKMDEILDSREKLQAADYQIKNGLLYRAHLSNTTTIQNKGLLRNTSLHSNQEDGKSYISSVFKHTAGTGSEGAIMSLSTRRSIAKKFMNDHKKLVAIDLNKLGADVAESFVTVPELILKFGGMMLREGLIEHLDLIKVLDQLNNKEHEVFFVGRTENLNFGEIPARAISVAKVKGQKTFKSSHHVK
ncbi:MULTISPECIES: RHS repeat domain-containing protein [unclassified Pseudomonas]|uniref:RHS repeat domain-containing protein n=1 Tax=unclassified Pseudomonas TaxID=196821 RepID=UPI001CC119B2|nr:MULTISPECIES: RHS repeat-associated core domain-containing protein [unclassified Pseudomonas]